MAAEVSAQVSRVLCEELGSLGDSEAVSALLQHPLLKENQRKRAREASDEVLATAFQSGVQLLSGEDLPPNLNDLPGTPIGLMIDGDAQSLSRPTLGIVGTRSAGSYGKACAQKFAEAAAKAGVTVISGGAVGIDAAAHTGALEAGGYTVAVLPVGVDVAYPAVNSGLFRQIRSQGCLLSQFALGSKVQDHRLLNRNNLIAALSDALLVVEAPLRSGALHTAHAAADYGREVFVVPATINFMTFQGSFALIREGATLVSHPNEMFEAMGIAPIAATEAPEAEGIAARILAVMSVEPKPAEKIVTECGLETAEVLSELTMLELDGRILRGAGGYALKP